VFETRRPNAKRRTDQEGPRPVTSNVENKAHAAENDGTMMSLRWLFVMMIGRSLRVFGGVFPSVLKESQSGWFEV